MQCSRCRPRAHGHAALRHSPFSELPSLNLPTKRDFTLARMWTSERAQLNPQRTIPERNACMIRAEGAKRLCRRYTHPPVLRNHVASTSLVDTKGGLAVSPAAARSA